MTRQEDNDPARIASLEDLGRALRRARKEQGYTQGEMAEALGVSVPTIRAIEKGEPGASLGTMFQLIGDLDLTLRIERLR
jgi:HTH-type transcriptional regulator/antitoxin HipB